VDGHELVELDVLVGNVGLEVKSWVDDLDLGDELVLVFKFEWLANVDNDTEAVYFISAVFILSSLCLKLVKISTRVTSILSSRSSALLSACFAMLLLVI
jgi:hypothetical protein